MKSVLMALAAAGLACSGADAGVFTFNFTMDGSQEVPPRATPSTGTALVTLDDATNLLTWDYSFTELLGPQTGAHFHVAPIGVNGPIIIPLPLGSPIMGSQVISDAHEAEFLAGNVYLNIHSTVFPGGEIRGQVVPTPGALGLLGLGGLALVGRRRR